MKSNVISQAFLSAAGEGKILPMTGQVKVSATQTGGEFELVELNGPGGPTSHVHREHDECFYIIKGTFTFILGQEEVEAQAGSVVFVPRGMPHSFKHSEGGRSLVFVIPANLEGFFQELGEGLIAGRSEADLRAELAGKYDSWPIK